MSGLRPRALLRSAIIAATVLVLVPAWMARVAYVYVCRDARAVCCASAHKKPARAPDLESRVRPACCAADAVSLAAERASGAAHDTVAAPVRADAIVIVAAAEPARLVDRAAAITPRATGPPSYLRNLSLLL